MYPTNCTYEPSPTVSPFVVVWRLWSAFRAASVAGIAVRLPQGSVALLGVWVWSRSKVTRVIVAESPFWCAQRLFFTRFCACWPPDAPGSPASRRCYRPGAWWRDHRTDHRRVAVDPSGSDGPTGTLLRLPQLWHSAARQVEIDPPRQQSRVSRTSRRATGPASLGSPVVGMAGWVAQNLTCGRVNYKPTTRSAMTRRRDSASAPTRLGRRVHAERRGSIDRRQWFAAEAVARADLATHQDVLAAAGWTPVPFQP